MICRALLIVCIIFCVSSTTATAQADAIFIRIRSSPSGAAVKINGKYAGKTDFSMRLSAGVHEFEFSLSGYPTRKINYVVAGFQPSIVVDFNMQDAPSVTKNLIASFPNIGSEVLWDTANQLRFTTPYGQSNSFTYVLDTNTNILSSVESYWTFGSVPESSPLRAKFNISEKISRYDPSTWMFQSPSGRYILYATTRKKEFVDGLSILLNIYDAKREKNVLFENVRFSSRPLWTANEKVMYQHGYASKATIFFLFDDDEIRYVHVAEFTTKDGKRIATYNQPVMFTRPSENGYVVLYGLPADEEGFSGLTAYLVNYRTLIGEKIMQPTELNTSFIFSPDGKWVYYQDQEGLKRLLTENPARRELISVEFPITQTRVHLSYTLEYAVIQRFTSFGNFHLYKMHLPD